MAQRRWLKRRVLLLGILLAVLLLMALLLPATGLDGCLGMMTDMTAHQEAGGEEGAWELRSAMSILRSEISAAVLDEQIVVAGGISFFGITDKVERYDVRRDEWTTIGSLPRPLHHVALAACDGRIFASGGYTTLGFAHDEEATLWQYEALTDRWVTEAALPHPLGEHAMACLNEQLYLVGGRERAGESAAIWAYDLSNRSWSQKADMPTPRHSTAIALLDGWLYVMGGRNSTGGAQLDVVEAYDPITDRWQTRSPMPIGRGGHAAASLNGRIHLFGGERFDTGEVLSAHEVYDPLTDTWQNAPPLATPRHGLAAEVVDNRILAIGGGCRYGLHTIYSVTGTVQSREVGSPTSLDDIGSEQ